MKKVVIDTNCLIASIPPHREEYWLYRAFSNFEFTWVVSTEILNEYHEQLAEFYSQETADLVLKVLLSAPNIELAVPYYRWQLIKQDPDDNKFADLALAVNATYLVSEDRHFNVLRKINFPKIEVVKLKEFRKLLNFQ